MPSLQTFFLAGLEIKFKEEYVMARVACACYTLVT